MLENNSTILKILKQQHKEYIPTYMYSNCYVNSSLTYYVCIVIVMYGCICIALSYAYIHICM